MTHIVIEVQGGAVREVYADQDLDYTLLDHDLEAVEPDYQPQTLKAVVDAEYVRSIAGWVEVYVVPAAEAASWSLRQGTLNEALANLAFRKAEGKGLVTDENRDRAYITVEFEDGAFHCYLQFEEA